MAEVGPLPSSNPAPTSFKEHAPREPLRLTKSLTVRSREGTEIVGKGLKRFPFVCTGAAGLAILLK